MHSLPWCWRRRRRLAVADRHRESGSDFGQRERRDDLRLLGGAGWERDGARSSGGDGGAAECGEL